MSPQLPTNGGQANRISDSTRQVLRETGRASQADVARATGLPRSTVRSSIYRLIHDGLLVKGENGPDIRSPKGGRPPTTWYSLVPDAGYVIGVDIGHHELHVGVADLSQQICTPEGLPEAPQAQGNTDAEPAETLNMVAKSIKTLIRDHELSPEKIVGIGLSIPAPVDPDGRIPQRGLPAWTAEFSDPAEALRRRLPRWADGLPMYAGNDSTLGMLAEIVHGAARSTSDAIYLRISQGIGGGLLVGGQLQRGAHSLAGEIGHVPITDGAGPLCPRCGTSCIEARAATPALLKILEPTHGDIDGTQLLALARSGDAAATAVLRLAGQTIGGGLAGLCDTLDPDLVIIGGQLAESDVLLDALRTTLIEQVFGPIAERLTVTRSDLGTLDQLYGAIALVLERVPRERRLVEALGGPKGRSGSGKRSTGSDQ